MRTGHGVRFGGRLRARVALAAVGVTAAVAAPLGLGAAAAADPTRLTLRNREVPAPFTLIGRYGPAEVRSSILGLAAPFGTTSVQYRIASNARCAEAGWEYEHEVGLGRLISEACVVSDAASAKTLVRLFLREVREYTSGRCRPLSPSFGQSSGVFKWCTGLNHASALALWSYKNVVVLYGRIDPAFPDDQPTAAEGFAPARKQAARLRAMLR